MQSTIDYGFTNVAFTHTASLNAVCVRLCVCVEWSSATASEQ
jgi:hypothetical protein